MCIQWLIHPHTTGRRDSSHQHCPAGATSQKTAVSFRGQRKWEKEKEKWGSFWITKLLWHRLRESGEDQDKNFKTKQQQNPKLTEKCDASKTKILFRNLCHEKERHYFVCLIWKQGLKVPEYLFLYINSNCLVQMLQKCVLLVLWESL